MSSSLGSVPDDWHVAKSSGILGDSSRTGRAFSGTALAPDGGAAWAIAARAEQIAICVGGSRVRIGAWDGRGPSPRCALYWAVWSWSSRLRSTVLFQ